MKESSLKYKDEILRLWNNGFSLNQICDNIDDVKRDTIRKILKNNGIEPKIRKQKLINKQKISDIIFDIKSGISISECMRKYKTSNAVIKRVLKQNNIELVLKSTSFDEYTKMYSKEDIEPLLSFGSINHIYKTLGIPPETARLLIEYHGLEFTLKYPKVSNIDQDTINLIIDHRMMCYTPVEISKKFQITPQLVRKILKKNSSQLLERSPIIPQKRKEFESYTKTVRRISALNLKYNNLTAKEGYHWNHKLSIVDGFRYNVPADLLSTISNLELIPQYENLALNWRSKITIEEFKEMVIAF